MLHSCSLCGLTLVMGMGKKLHPVISLPYAGEANTKYEDTEGIVFSGNDFRKQYEAVQSHSDHVYYNLTLANPNYTTQRLSIK